MTDSNFERLEQLIVNLIKNDIKDKVVVGFAKVEGEIKLIDEKIKKKNRVHLFDETRLILTSKTFL